MYSLPSMSQTRLPCPFVKQILGSDFRLSETTPPGIHREFCSINSFDFIMLSICSDSLFKGGHSSRGSFVHGVLRPRGHDPLNYDIKESRPPGRVKIRNAHTFSSVQCGLMGDDTRSGIGQGFVNIDLWFAVFDDRRDKFMRDKSMGSPMSTIMSHRCGQSFRIPPHLLVVGFEFRMSHGKPSVVFGHGFAGMDGMDGFIFVPHVITHFVTPPFAPFAM